MGRGRSKAQASRRKLYKTAASARFAAVSIVTALKDTPNPEHGETFLISAYVLKREDHWSPASCLRTLALTHTSAFTMWRCHNEDSVEQKGGLSVGAAIWTRNVAQKPWVTVENQQHYQEVSERSRSRDSRKEARSLEGAFKGHHYQALTPHCF